MLRPPSQQSNPFPEGETGKHRKTQTRQPTSPSFDPILGDDNYLEKVRWSPRRWTIYIALALLAQLFYFATFINKQQPPSRQPAHEQHNYMAASVCQPLDDTNTSTLVDAIIQSFDPRIFAIPHSDGLSAQFWNKKPDTIYNPPSHIFPSYAITPDMNSIERELNTILASASDIQEMPDPPYDVTQKLREPTPRAPVTVTTITFDTQKHPNWQTPKVELPPQKTTTPLTDTIIRTSVSSDGRIFSATVQKSCGLDAADKLAAQQINKTRLLPKNPSRTPQMTYPTPYTAPETILFTIRWATVQ